MYQPCPRCDGKRVIKIGKGMVILTGILLGSFITWVGLLIPPLLLLGPLFIIGMIIGSFFIKPKLFCQNCRYSWYPHKLQTNASEN